MSHKLYDSHEVITTACQPRFVQHDNVLSLDEVAAVDYRRRADGAAGRWRGAHDHSKFCES
ncbi:hypothetical protein J6590_085761 [Homalodisca vitripennis]|nr:hypothetical protein J6590_085761 [Homalodisca vitripennis]